MLVIEVCVAVAVLIVAGATASWLQTGVALPSAEGGAREAAAPAALETLPVKGKKAGKKGKPQKGGKAVKEMEKGGKKKGPFARFKKNKA